MSEPKHVSNFVDEALAMCGVSSERESDAVRQIRRLRELSAKRDELLDDLERSLLLQEFDPKAFESGTCPVSMKSRQRRDPLHGQWVSWRRDWTVTINGVDCNGLDLPDPLWNSLMVVDGQPNGKGWKPRRARKKVSHE